MKNICLLVESLLGAGIERIVINLARALQQQGNQVSIIARYKTTEYAVSDLSIFFINDSFSFYDYNKYLKYIHSYLLLYYLYNNNIQRLLLRREISALRKILAQAGNHCDLIVAHSPDLHLLCTLSGVGNHYCCIHESISKKSTIPVNNLIYSHNNAFNTVNKLYRLLPKKWRVAIIKRATHQLYNQQNIITVAKEIADDALHYGITPKIIKTIYNPFNFANIRTLAKSYQVAEANYIVAIGRLNAYKAFDILIAAYAKAQLPQKLLILGKGEEQKKLQALILSLQLQTKVELLGFNQNPYPYIQKAKALVVSGRIEGLPNVLVEAMILGVPIVSTACCGVRELMTSELAAFISPIDDVSALAKNMRKVIEKPPVIRKQYYQQFHHLHAVNAYMELCR